MGVIPNPRRVSVARYKDPSGEALASSDSTEGEDSGEGQGTGELDRVFGDTASHQFLAALDL